MSIAAATCAPGVKSLPNVWPERLYSSPPRKRGSRAMRKALAFLDSRFRRNDGLSRSTVSRVVRRLAGHCDVVDVALAQSGGSDPHQGAVLLHLVYRAVAGIAHRRPQPTDQLVDDVADGSLVRHTPLDPLGHELQRARHLLLEIAVGRTARHRSDRAHPAVVFIAAALIEEHLARALVGPGKERAEHCAIRPGGDRLGEVAGEFDAAIGDHRHTRLAALGDGIDDRGELRDADPAT